jgi:iron complex outermembrane receptor protein
MNKFATFALSTVSFAALTASPAFAQTASPVSTTPQKTQEGESVPPTSAPTNAKGQPAAPGNIVITGSRLRRDNYSTPQNVDILTRDDQVLAGTRSPAETLQSATVTSGTSQISGSFLGFLSQGGQGANLTGLRGLGAQRTLVLLNGRRLAPAGAGPELVAADLNVLPSAVVQRIEILREGASSIYGSDAIAGVINIITDTKMDGLTLDAYADVPTNVDHGKTYRASITAGKTFSRGYITGSFEYHKDQGLTLGDNKDWDCPRELAYVNGVEVGQGSPTDPNLVRCFPYAPRLNTGVASGYALTKRITSTGGFTSGPRTVLNDDGTLSSIALTPAFDYQRPLGDIPQVLKGTVFTKLKTYTAFVSAGYDLGILGDAELYGEGLFTRRKSAQQNYSTQTFQQVVAASSAGTFTDPYQLYFGNSTIGGKTYTCPQVFGAEYCSPFAPTALNSSGINYFGPLISLQQTLPRSQKVDFFRANGGIRGNLGFGDWRYDANAMVSRTEAEDHTYAALLQQLGNTINAVKAPSGTPAQYITVAGPGTTSPGNYTCAANVNPVTGAYNGGNCVAVNIFDPNLVNRGQFPAGFMDYVYTDSVGTTKYNQDTYNIVLDGSLFNLQGGKVTAAIGAERRHDFIDDVPSFQRQQGLLAGYGTAGRTTGSDTVTEFFGELDLPIFKNRPFFSLLDLHGSARQTHYQSYGNGFTYSLNAQWAPISNIRFRGNYSTNFRAPDLYEQFIADQIGFYPATVDPCDQFVANYQASDTVYKNCLAALTPILGNAGALAYKTNGGSVQVTTSGGRGVLKAEKARTWGVGVVLTAPRRFADFTMAIDYFNVTVKGEVDTLGNLLLNFCYESTDFPNAPECQFIGPRKVDPTSVNNGQLTTLRNPYLNIAQQKAQGIDFDARYSTRLFGARFSTQLQATRMLKQEQESFAGEGLTDYNGTLGYPGQGAGPKWVGSLDTRLKFDNGLTVRWGMKYVGKAHDDRRDFYLTSTGLSCTVGTAGCLLASYDQTAEPYLEHGVSIQYLLRNIGQVTLGVNNLFNEKPPTIAAYPGASNPTRIGNFLANGPYDYRGRSVFLNLTRTFK